MTFPDIASAIAHSEAHNSTAARVEVRDVVALRAALKEAEAAAKAAGLDFGCAGNDGEGWRCWADAATGHGVFMMWQLAITQGCGSP